MSLELIAVLVTAFLQSAMLTAALVLVYRQGRQLEQLEVNDKVIVLQNRRIEDVVKEANALIREELQRKVREP